MDAVSEVLAARMVKSDGLNSMLGWSAIAHLVMVALVAFVPTDWWGAEDKAPEIVMQISLGGAVGPRDGGLATLGAAARPVKTRAPTVATASLRNISTPL